MKTSEVYSQWCIRFSLTTNRRIITAMHHVYICHREKIALSKDICKNIIQRLGGKYRKVMLINIDCKMLVPNKFTRKGKNTGDQSCKGNKTSGSGLIFLLRWHFIRLDDERTFSLKVQHGKKNPINPVSNCSRRQQKKLINALYATCPITNGRQR